VRRRNYIFLAIAALVLCIVPQKIVLFFLPYALKRIGGNFFKQVMRTYKYVSDALKLIAAFH
jgi:hypothetical protein